LKAIYLIVIIVGLSNGHLPFDVLASGVAGVRGGRGLGVLQYRGQRDCGSEHFHGGTGWAEVVVF
jgi:hypothetical protein